MTAAAVAIVVLAAGAAHAEGWTLRCEDDQVDDYRTCFLSSEAATVVGIMTARGTTDQFVTTGFDHYPGSDVVFRVDRNPPLRWHNKEATGDSKALIEQMLTGKKLLGRWTKWPSGTDETRSASLTGFREKLAEMRMRLADYATGS